MQPLVLYDIPSKLPGKCYSHNTTKSRFILGYKGLPFETVWVEYPDITAKVKQIGASPSKSSDGSQHYTLPVLSDPNTGVHITDSWDIAIYLDKTYPEKPIFPRDSEGLITAFESAVIALQGASLRFTLLRTHGILNDHVLEYWTSGKEAFLGEKIDGWSPEGPRRDAHWAVIEKNFLGSVKTWYDRVEGKWLMGDTFSYADVILAARLFWFKRVFHDDEWKRVASLHDGKWGRFFADVEKECNSVIDVSTIGHL